MRIISTRGRVQRELLERQKLLEQQFQISSAPPSKEHEANVKRAFDMIRRQIERYGG